MALLGRRQLGNKIHTNMAPGYQWVWHREEVQKPIVSIIEWISSSAFVTVS